MVDGENTCCSNLCLAPAYLLTPAPLPPLPLHTEKSTTYNTYCDITTTHLLIRECEVREGNTQSYSLFKNLLKIFREQILKFEF